MLSFFRNFTKSRYGLIAVFLFLGLIAIAFAAGDITGIRNGAAGATSSTLATVGGEKIRDVDVRDRIDRFLSNLRREGQNVTMEQFLAQGGLEIAIDEMINSAAMVEFARKYIALYETVTGKSFEAPSAGEPIKQRIRRNLAAYF